MERDELERYEQNAEDRFDNYHQGEFEGDFDDAPVEEVYDEYYEDDGFEYEYEDPYEYEEFIEVPAGYEDEYDNYIGGTIQSIDPNDRTYTVIVKNTTTADADVVLFGANEALAPPTGVTIEVAESSHNEVREESKSNPFTIVGMKMSVTDSAQFDNVLHLVHRTPGGTKREQVVQPQNYVSPQNYDKKLIDAADFHFECSGKDSIRFTVKPGTVVFTFTKRSGINLANALAGKNVAELSTAPRITGLPQIDLMRKRKAPAPFGLKKRKMVARPVQAVRRKVKKLRSGRPRKRRGGGGMGSFLRKRR